MSRAREGLVRYVVNDTDGMPRRVQGVRVGRFGVRHRSENELAPYLPDGGVWHVDHIPTGFAAATFSDPEEAFAFADDISRFSASDPSSSDRRKTVSQIGEVVRNWAMHVRRLGRYVPFREWFQDNAPEWRPPRMKMSRGFEGLAQKSLF